MSIRKSLSSIVDSIYVTVPTRFSILNLSSWILIMHGWYAGDTFSQNKSLVREQAENIATPHRNDAYPSVELKPQEKILNRKQLLWLLQQKLVDSTKLKTHSQIADKSSVSSFAKAITILQILLFVATVSSVPLFQLIVVPLD